MTSFDEIYQKFFNKIEHDHEFFVLYGISDEEATEIATKRAKDLLLESIARLTLTCTPEVDFHNYDIYADYFNFELTANEIELLSSLMREEYFKRDLVKLKAFAVHFSPKDLNLFSPANERKSFMEMVDKITTENNTKIYRYSSTDRLTGQLKGINYAKYEGY